MQSNMYIRSTTAQIKQVIKYITSDEAECWGLALIPHLLRRVLASRWKSRTSEKRSALLPRTHTVKALLPESGFSTLTTWKNVGRPDSHFWRLLPFISMQAAIWECNWQCFYQSSNAAFVSHYLSHWNDDMALAPILAGKTQVVLRQTDLAKRVEMAEGHPQEALMHL